MTKTRASVHPLFDSSSRYGQLRAGVRAEGKMLGFFRFRWVCAKLDGLPLPQGPGAPVAEAQQLFEEERASGLTLLDSFSAEALFLSTGPLHELGRWRVHFGLIRETDNLRALGCKGCVPLDVSESRRCRAFLLHPKVVAKLQARMGGRPLLHAFSAEVLADDPEVARMLASAPEMEGVCHDGKVVFDRLPVPDHRDAFPPSEEPLQVVIVLEAD
jgi:hypothetical protein